MYKGIIFSFLCGLFGVTNIIFGMENPTDNQQLINKITIELDRSNNPSKGTFYLHDSNNHFLFKLNSEEDRWMLCDKLDRDLSTANPTKLLRIDNQHFLVYDNDKKEVNIDNLLDKYDMKYIRHVAKHGQTRDILFHKIKPKASKTAIYALIENQFIRITEFELRKTKSIPSTDNQKEAVVSEKKNNHQLPEIESFNSQQSLKKIEEELNTTDKDKETKKTDNPTKKSIFKSLLSGRNALYCTAAVFFIYLACSGKITQFLQTFSLSQLAPQ